MGLLSVLPGAQFPSLEVGSHPFPRCVLNASPPLHPLQLFTSPQGTGTACTRVHTCKRAHSCPRVCVHTRARVSQCACEPVCSRVCAHPRVWGAIQGSLPTRGPRSSFHITHAPALPSAPGLGRAHQLCVCPCVLHVCHCQGSLVVGANVPGSCVSSMDACSSHLPLVKRGCGEGLLLGPAPPCATARLSPPLTCLPLFLHLSPETPDSRALPR